MAAVARGLGIVASAAVVAAGCSSSISPDGSATPLATDPSGSAVLATTSDTESQTGPDDSVADPSAPITPPASTLAVVPSTLTWEPAGGGLEQTTLEVPLDYNDPAGTKINLYALRLPATDPDVKIGSLLVNPGGPGYAGSELARYAETYFDPQIRKYFDIVGWDPRGTGRSDPAIDCTDDYDFYFTETDSTPNSDAERQVLIDRWTKFADDCRSRNTEVLQFVGTNNSARDMNQMRIALGEDQISYFGFSYGSELGATWMTMFPDTVRAAVLDGAADPSDSMLDSNVRQAAGFQNTLTKFFDWCLSNRCPFVRDGENPAQAFEQLANDLDENPIPSVEGRPPANRDVLVGAVVEAMYSDRFWNALGRALADARNGNGAGLLALYDEYYQRKPSGQYPNTLEAFYVISCMDEPARDSVAQTDGTAARFHEAAPLLFPDGAVPGYPCNFYPKSPDPRITITGAGAGPVIVIGTTGDPATPFEATRAMASTLEEGIFVTVDGNQHTGYGVNSCVVNLVNNYLIDLTVPDGDTNCS